MLTKHQQPEHAAARHRIPLPDMSTRFQVLLMGLLDHPTVLSGIEP